MPSAIQNIFVSIAGANLSRKKFAPGFSKLLTHIEETQWWPRDQLIEYQASKLRELVTFAYEHSKYYYKILNKNNLKPEDIKGVEDLTKMPMLTKEDLRTRISEITPIKRNDLGLELKHTSGTTGTALHFYWDRLAIMKEYAFVARHRRWARIEPFDLQATFGGRIIVPITQKSPPFWRNNLAEKQVFFSMYHLSEKNAIHYLKKLKKMHPRFIQGYPSMIFAIAKFSLEQGIDITGSKAIFTSSETLLQNQRRSIEKAFGCKVYDWYGNAELAASIGQCEKGRYHLNSEYCIIEIENDNDFKTNDVGEMICTSFINHGTPIIRYKVGDIARLSSSKCPCGRGLPVIEEIIGRCDDMLITPKGSYIGRMDHVFKDALMIKEAQIIQEAIDELKVLIVIREGFSQSDFEMLKKEFQTRLGNEMKLRFEIVDGIPREPNGKFRSVISRI